MANCMQFLSVNRPNGCHISVFRTSLVYKAALQMALQVAGESETGDDENDGEEGEEEAVDDDGQTTPVGLGGEAGCLVENTDSVVGRRRVAGAITDGDVGHHLERARLLATGSRR